MHQMGTIVKKNRHTYLFRQSADTNDVAIKRKTSELKKILFLPLKRSEWLAELYDLYHFLLHHIENFLAESLKFVSQLEY